MLRCAIIVVERKDGENDREECCCRRRSARLDRSSRVSEWDAENLRIDTRSDCHGSDPRGRRALRGGSEAVHGPEELLRPAEELGSRSHSATFCCPGRTSFRTCESQARGRRQRGEGWVPYRGLAKNYAQSESASRETQANHSLRGDLSKVGGAEVVRMDAALAALDPRRIRLGHSE